MIYGCQQKMLVIVQVHLTFTQFVIQYFEKQTIELRTINITNSETNKFLFLLSL